MVIAGGKWRWEYDERGNLVKRIDPLNAETLFEYTDGLLTGIIGANGERTQLEYDRDFNLSKTVSPDGGVNGWRYDGPGQRLWHENAKGGRTEYGYDLLGQLTQVKEPDGNLRNLTKDKKYAIVTDCPGTPAQMYDEKGQLVWAGQTHEN
jgi:YD repeat-containing protein